MTELFEPTKKVKVPLSVQFGLGHVAFKIAATILAIICAGALILSVWGVI